MVRSAIAVALAVAGAASACGDDGEAGASSAASRTRAKKPANDGESSGCPRGAAPYQFEQPGHGRVEGCRHPDGAFDGAYRVVRGDVVLLEGAFSRGKRVGTWTYRHDSGKPWRTGAYVDGLADGTWTEYGADGNALGQYRIRRGTGVESTWWPNGKLRRTTALKDGQRSGPTTEYFETGEKMTEAHYQADELHGTWTFWDRQGRTRKVESWDRGVIGNTVWYKDGVPLTQ